jgi:hypothetical protein
VKADNACQNAADATINNGASTADYETSGGTGVHTQYTCHHLCQEKLGC